MTKLVTLSLVQGDLNSGFGDVSVEIWNDGDSYPMKFHGSLPAASEIKQLYQRWRFLHQALYQSFNLQTRLGRASGFELEEEDVVQFSEVEFSNLCRCLEKLINGWLDSQEFRTIDQKLRQYLHPEEDIRFIIETKDKLLRKLPWHLWNFLEDYPHAEIALSPLNFQSPTNLSPKTGSQKVRILAIIGNSQGIDTQKDKELLEELSDRAEIDFLIEPKREELNNRLWEKGWDILYFAGHSSSKDKGIIKINQTDNLSLDKLKNALKTAIAGGLHLAIFNSCDGLGLAEELEDLNIPQVIVMREPVPDIVAHKFLRYFLQEFANGKSLYNALRSSREKLQGLEDKYPCATWLPVLSQNPATIPMVWSTPPVREVLPKWKNIAKFLAIATVVSASVLGTRRLGFLQSWELQAFDGMMQLQTSKETPDQRLLVVTVDEADIQYQFREGMDMEFSLSNQALMQLLKKLKKYKARTIGLDIYRNRPINSKYADLIKTLSQDNNLFAVCKVSAKEDGSDGLPPPTEVPKERLGFSDFVMDEDEILRRSLLSMTPASPLPCSASYGLSLKLAGHYLDTKGVESDITPEGNLKIGETLFPKLKPHTSGYQNIDASGYQILLNYRRLRSPENIAQTISLREILRNSTAISLEELIKNRIVLIGVTSPSSSDHWKTPYSSKLSPQDKLVAGVFMQAQMTSQILSAVLDNRPLLWWWEWWIEALWVWSWSLVGLGIVWYFKKPLHLIIITVSGTVILFGVSYLVFIQAGWIPFIPAVFTLLITIVGIFLIRQK